LRPFYYRDTTIDDVQTIHEVFDDLVYKPSWFNLKHDIKTVVDVGAFIGAFTLWAQEQWPNAKIHAYEPDPHSCELLTKNISKSRSKNTVAHNSAVWKTDCKLQLNQFSKTPGSNTVVYSKRPYTVGSKSNVTVNAISIKNVINEVGGRIDFLKLDCEGSEYEILYSLSKTDLQKIRYIVLESHEFDELKQNTAKRLSKFLRKMGFATQIIPMDVRSGMGLGYVYATNMGKSNDILNNVFDNHTSRVTDYLKSQIQSNTKLINLQKEFDERSKWAIELDKAVKEKDVLITKLQKEFDERSKWAIELDKAVKEKELQIKKEQSSITTKDSEIKDLQSSITTKDSEIENIQSSINKKDSEIKDLQSSITTKDSEIENIQSSITTKDSEIKDLQSSITTKDSEIKDLQSSITTKDSEIENIQSSITTKDSEIKELENNLVSQESYRKELQKNIDTKESQLDEVRSEFFKQGFELEQIKNSIIFRFFQKIAKGIDKNFPPDTKRGEMIRLMRNAYLTNKNEGFGVLMAATKQKIGAKKSYKISTNQSISKKTKLKTIDKNKKGLIFTSKPDNSKDPALRKFLEIGSANVTNLKEFPKISIIILTYNQPELLQKNLQAIKSKTTYKNYEIIIVTNNTDKNSKMRRFLDSLKNPVYVYDKEYSFGGMNNYGASKSTGDYLLFLNDDVEIVNPYWLESLLSLSLKESTGVVGGKLLFPNGKLQEAGCIIWRNGTGWNYGRNANADDHKFNYIRDVDYCSGCCLFVKKQLFDRVKGFDKSYHPAYCEDADLCFTIRKLGYRILYQPLASIVHFEGMTQGVNVNKGIKSYQIVNQKKFAKKWENDLKSHLMSSEENSLIESNRKDGINIRQRLRFFKDIQYIGHFSTHEKQNYFLAR